MEDLVKQAVITIRRHYDEPLHLDDLARVATMSKFHFLRTFRGCTGVTPARYLSAVRIQAAKRLLLNTSLDVAEISLQVGYGSLGTFTTRFTESVGLPPVRFRRMARGETAIPLVSETGSACTPGAHADGSGTVFGTVLSSRPISTPIMLGLFPSRIPQGQPAACTSVPESGVYRIDGVPYGTWHLLGVTVLGADAEAANLPFLVTSPRILRVQEGGRARADMMLRDVHWTDPPLLVALPGVDALTARAA
jgi:AraC family transcriptional regulator